MAKRKQAWLLVPVFLLLAGLAVWEILAFGDSSETPASVSEAAASDDARSPPAKVVDAPVKDSVERENASTVEQAVAKVAPPPRDRSFGAPEHADHKEAHRSRTSSGLDRGGRESDIVEIPKTADAEPAQEEEENEEAEEPEEAEDVAGSPAAAENQSEKAPAEQAAEQVAEAVPTGTAVGTFRNEVSDWYRLRRLSYFIDGEHKADFAGDAADGAELFRERLPAGEHILSVIAEYEGQRVFWFSYLKDYRFKMTTHQLFTVSPDRGASLQVVANEIKKAFARYDQRLSMVIETD